MFSKSEEEKFQRMATENIPVAQMDAYQKFVSQTQSARTSLPGGESLILGGEREESKEGGFLKASPATGGDVFSSGARGTTFISSKPVHMSGTEIFSAKENIDIPNPEKEPEGFSLEEEEKEYIFSEVEGIDLSSAFETSKILKRIWKQDFGSDSQKMNEFLKQSLPTIKKWDSLPMQTPENARILVNELIENYAETTGKKELTEGEVARMKGNIIILT